MKITKTGQSQFGFYVLAEDGKFKGCTDAVSKYLTGKLPAEIEVQEQQGEAKNQLISRVKILGQSAPAGHSQENRQQGIEETARLRREIDWRIACLTGVVSLVNAGQVKLKEMGLYYGHLYNYQNQPTPTPAYKKGDEDEKMEVPVEKVQ